MFTLYTAYTDDEPDDVIIEELIDWLSRRMPKTVEAFKKRRLFSDSGVMSWEDSGLSGWVRWWAGSERADRPA